VILDAESRLQERGLRASLIAGFANYDESRKDLGLRLFQYRELYKPLHGVWSRIIGFMVVHTGHSLRTLYRILEEHEIAQGYRAPKKSPSEVSEADANASLDAFPLSSEQDAFFVSRSLFREAVGEYRGPRLKEFLEQLISIEAYDSLEIEKPFVLKITPRRSMIQVSPSTSAWPHADPAASDDFDVDASSVPVGFPTESLFLAPTVTTEAVQ
jgi:hypothetical protein